MDRDELVENFQLSEYIGVTYSQKILCPFHTEKTPSMYINTETQRFRCFGCGESGTIIDWLMLENGYTVSESFAFLRKELGGAKTSIRKKPQPLNNAQSFSHRIENISLNGYHPISKKRIETWVSNLQKDKYAKEYLINKRYFSPEDIRRFGFGLNDRGDRIIIPIWKFKPFQIMASYQSRNLNKEGEKYLQSKNHPRTIPCGVDSFLENSDTVLVFFGDFDAYLAKAHGIPAISLGSKNYHNFSWKNIVLSKNAIIIPDKGEYQQGVKVKNLWRKEFGKSVFIYRWGEKFPDGYDYTDYCKENPPKKILIDIWETYKIMHSRQLIDNIRIHESIIGLIKYVK